MRIIIAGSRFFNDYDFLSREVNRIIKELNVSFSDISIISGTAIGADQLGEKFAKENNINLKYFPAQWDKLGKAAGFLRNKEMANYAKEDNGVLIAFWNGKSRGTSHMIDYCKYIELKVFVCKL